MKKIRKIHSFARHNGSIVLGFNDAIIELTGVLSGLTFALDESRVIAAVGVVTGISASLSMGVSEYFSSREEGKKHPFHAGFITGLTYIITVLFLVTPFLFLVRARFALLATYCVSMLIVFFFNFYVSNLEKVSASQRFFQMSFSVAAVALVSYATGSLVNYLLL